MKRILVFLFAMLVLAACNQAGGAFNQDLGENNLQETEVTEKTEDEEQKEPVVIEAYMPTNQLDIYGYVTVLIIMKNNSNETVKIHEGDFTLYDNESDTEFEILVDFGNYDAMPEELTLAPNEENYTIGYYNISIERPDINWGINIDEFEMRYIGDTDVQEDTIALKVDLYDKYAELISELTNSQEMEINAGITDESNNYDTQQGLVISVYGPFDDKDAYVRVQNTSSNKTIYYDSTELYVYDNVTRYGPDPRITDSAFSKTMYIQPGQIVDYREIFLFDNHLAQGSSEIGENIKGIIYGLDETVHINYYHEDDLPEDFFDYD